MKCFKLPKCVFNENNMSELAEQMSEPNCKIQKLSLDFGMALKSPIVERLMIFLLERNRSLRTLKLLRSVRLEIEVTIPLL